MSSRLVLRAATVLSREPGRWPITADGASTTRRRILEAATALLRQQDGRQVSMRAIAERAGVSRQALYLHFDDRAELLVATVDHIDSSGPLSDLHQRVWNAHSGAIALDRFVELHADYSPRIIEVARTIDAGRLADPDLAAAWNDRMAGRRRACARVIQRLQDDGALDDSWTVDNATDYLWVQTSLRVWDDLVNVRDWPRDRYIETMQSTLRSALVQAH